MLKIITKAKTRFMNDESGATAIEYGLIAVAISVAISAAVFTFGDELVAVFEGLSGSLANPNG